MESDDEVVWEGETRIRHSGNVEVATIPSEVAKTTPVKRSVGKILKMRLIRRMARANLKGHYYIFELKLEDKQ